ncbi:GNAT family N-acetyltransferase [Yoonia sp. BS5-3]|uniref:GNAT family N-acetyltransferase n=1 Tax=Yoonia phaeophyticola TaxID=3137369 RepID=A0ABZ2V8J5_9RHOB
MGAALYIRTAKADDLPALTALYQHLSPEDPPCPPALAAENFAQFQTYGPSAIFVGCDDDRLLCSCTLVVIPNLTRGGRPYALIENVVTHNGYRNQGFGKKILDAACVHAWAQNCYKVMLMTGSKRPSTLKFYESAGFAQNKTGFQKRAPGF